MTDKRTYLQMLADQLRKWDHEIDELRVTAYTAKTESRNEHIRQLDELHMKKEMARNKMKQLQETGDASWSDIKVGLEKMKELKSAFSNVSARFK